MCLSDDYRRLKLLTTINKQEEMVLSKIDFILNSLCIYTMVLTETLNILGNILGIRDLIIITTVVFYVTFLLYSVLFTCLIIISFIRVKMKQLVKILNGINDINAIVEDDFKEALVSTSILDKNLWKGTFRRTKLVIILTTINLLHLLGNILYLLTTVK